MAKKSNRNSRRSRGMKRNKLQPAVKTMLFNVPVGSSTVDVSQCASLLNRRFYRQGINWAVAGFRVFKTGATPVTGTGLSVARLPDTWILSNSWEKSMRSWLKMINESIDETDSVKPRFMDFKVYMDTFHHGSGTDHLGVPIPAPNLLPVSIDSNAVGGFADAVAGEWEYSSLHIPDDASPGNTRERELIVVGKSFPGAGTSGLNAVSLIEGYAASRSLPAITDPNVPDDAASASGLAPENWMQALFNEGINQDDEVIEDLITENNQSPYPYENAQVPGAAPGVVFTDTHYPGGENQLDGLQIVDLGYFSAGTNSNKLYLKGDTFPCGLIRFTNATDADLQVVVDLVPGPHRGYLCQPMTEM
ncbi:MAG: hypothetical protein [Circular genetic element sp.]|nr:MAG: hypothetical protein [Circular genetic element sp.]